MKARDVMTCEHLWVCSETSDVRHVAQLMAEHSIGSVPVVDSEGHLQGIVTDRDIVCRAIAKGKGYDTPVRDCMSQPVQCCDADCGVSEVEDMMKEYQIRRLPVVDENRRLVGYISIADLARCCHGLYKEHQLADTLEAVSSPTPVMERT